MTSCVTEREDKLCHCLACSNLKPNTFRLYLHSVFLMSRLSFDATCIELQGRCDGDSSDEALDMKDLRKMANIFENQNGLLPNSMVL